MIIDFYIKRLKKKSCEYTYGFLVYYSFVHSYPYEAVRLLIFTFS